MPLSCFSHQHRLRPGVQQPKALPWELAGHKGISGTYPQTQEQSRTILDSLPEGVVVISETSIVYANPYTFELLLGKRITRRRSTQSYETLYAPEQYHEIRAAFVSAVEFVKDEAPVPRQDLQDLNRPLTSLGSKTADASPLMTLGDFIWGGHQARGHELIRFVHEIGGEKRILGVTWTEMESESERLTSFSLKDLTAMEELAREKMNSTLERVMMATITHELRSPLHGILGMLEQIQAQVETPQLLHYCRIGINTGKIMMHLINDILDFSQIEANKLRLNYSTFRPQEIVQECIELFQLQAGRKKIALRMTLKSPDIPVIYSDMNRYRQIILNLVSNALKFTFKGFIEVSIKYLPEKGALKTNVQDTGIGISEEDIGKLFRLFGKLERSAQVNTQGVGLGLVVCKKLANALGGDIHVKSKLGEGSTFKFFIISQDVAGVGSGQRNKAELRPAIPGTVPTAGPGLAGQGRGSRLLLPGNSSSSIDIQLRIEDEPHPQTTGKHITGRMHKRSRTRLAPTADARLLQEEEKLLDPHPKPCTCHKVLIVDDDEMNLLVLENSLGRLHLECDTVRRG